MYALSDKMEGLSEKLIEWRTHVGKQEASIVKTRKVI